MKTIFKKSIAAFAFVVVTIGPAQVQANELMFKLFIQAQDLSEQQEQLAYELMASLKALSEQVKKPRQELKSFVQQLETKEQLDVEVMMSAYNNWKSDVDDKVYISLQSLANFHAELTPEQRSSLLAAVKKLKSK